MSYARSTFSVRVDVTNPGQFFACCGLFEVAHRLWPGAEAWFDSNRFEIAISYLQNELPADIFHALTQCGVSPVFDGAYDHKTAPIKLGPPICIRLDWWLRDDGKPNLFKTWAANATSFQMFLKWHKPFSDILTALSADSGKVLTVSRSLQGSYGFDSDLGWDALSVGFSLNEHASLKQLPTRPAVELFGAIGLQRFFPVFDPQRQVVEYATWGVPLTAPVARLAMLGMASAVTKNRLRTRFVYRGSFKGLATANVI